MYVCLYVRFRGKRDFLGPYIALIFCVHIPLLYLFYKHFVRRSVGQDTKGKRASQIMDVVILVLKLSHGVVVILLQPFRQLYSMGHMIKIKLLYEVGET